MSEISQFDGKVLKPLFKILHKSGIGTPIVQLAMKVLEYVANGPNPNGRYGKRIKWADFDRILLVGQSHLDAAWRWRTKQGIIKARATFKKALDHIDELRHFTYSQPSPQYYQWIKDTDSEYISQLYPRIKKAVKEGRWVIFGGSWVESDTNVPCGEALVRQRLYGQRFYLQEFGHISDVEFLMDCFGFNWNLPQIYKKSGAKMFGTGKLFWNENTKIPVGMCHWKAPDGTKLPMIHINFGYFLPITIGKDYPLIYLLGKSRKKLTASYATPQWEYSEWRSNELMMEHPFGYGLGDGGHGPIEAEIAIVRTFERLFRKKVKHHQKGDLYAMLKKYFPRWAIWEDEWYLDLHRGTYTSVSRIKRGNRDSENEIISLEKLVTTSSLFGFSDFESFKSSLEMDWKIVLYNQFHDILPGSSCPEVYLDYDKDLEAFYKSVITSKMEVYGDILNSLDLNREHGIPFIVFNPSSWIREDFAFLEIQNRSEGCVRASDGSYLPTSIHEKTWNTLRPNEDHYMARFNLKSHPIPALGFNVFYFDEKGKQVETKDSDSVNINKKGDHLILQNSEVELWVSKSTGLLDKYMKKRDDINVFEKPSNKILVFRENKKTNAWNIDPDYEKNPIEYRLEECEVEIIKEDSNYCAIQIRRKIGDSRFLQRIELDSQSKGITLSMDVDLKNPKWLVKLEFNTKIKTNTVTSEIPYAYIDRSIEAQTILDSARWEHACQKWISIFDSITNLGFSLTNNGKYAYNAKIITRNDGSEFVSLRPTIVRSPQYTGYASETKFVNRGPDGGIDPSLPHFTDLEHHHDIQIRAFIHQGDWKENRLWKFAYEHNCPLKANLLHVKRKSPKNNSSVSALNLPLSILSVDNDNVRIGALKIHEDQDSTKEYFSLIVRLVNMIGDVLSTKIDLASFFKIISAEEVNLLELEYHEANKEDVNVEGDKIVCTLTPYEIKTVKIYIKKE